MREALLEIPDEPPLRPEGEDVQELPGLAVGEICDKLYPPGIPVKLPADMRERLVKADDLGEVSRHRRGEAGDDDVDVMGGHAAHPGAVLPRHDGAQVIGDALREWDRHMRLPAEPWDVLHEGSPACQALEPLPPADDPAGAARPLGDVPCVEFLEPVLLDALGSAGIARPWLSRMVHSDVDARVAVGHARIADIAHGDLPAQAGEEAGT